MVQAASLLYMDPTAGVGFSYSSNSDDYAYNDTQAQEDMQSTLRIWFQTYPYFANHSVFLDGEVTRSFWTMMTASFQMCGSHLASALS